MLRGILFHEPFVEVEREDGTTAWAFRGGLAKRGDLRPTGLSSPTRFNFAAFGEYDLSSWDEVARDETGAGDVTYETTRYEKDSRFMEITHYYSEYNDGYTYKLIDRDGATLKSRELVFDRGSRTYTETVVDNTGQDELTLQRELSVGDAKISGTPLTLTGEWKTL